jgi:hypothetical protein
MRFCDKFKPRINQSENLVIIGSIGCLRGGIGPTGWQHWLPKRWQWPHRVAALAA